MQSVKCQLFQMSLWPSFCLRTTGRADSQQIWKNTGQKLHYYKTTFFLKEASSGANKFHILALMLGNSFETSLDMYD